MKREEMSKSASFAKHKMRENRNNQYRPEQQQMCSELRRCGEFNEWSILMEYVIPYKKEDGSWTQAVADIFIEEVGVVYRLNGAIHKNNTQELKDWEQKIYLEQLGYLVIDVEI